MNKHIIKFDEFKGYTSNICRSLGTWRPDYIVGLTRGGLLPAVMISHWLDVPMHSLDVSLRDHEASESNLWMAEDAFAGKQILIVDDINDQGSTINWIIDDWQSSCMPNSERWNDVWNNNVKFAVIVDNFSSQCRVAMDFWGMEINKAENNVWIEFPYEEWWAK